MVSGSSVFIIVISNPCTSSDVLNFIRPQKFGHRKYLCPQYMYICSTVQERPSACPRVVTA